MSKFELDTRGMEQVIQSVESLSEKGTAEKEINEYLQTKAADEIKEGITPLIPVSGRSWRGKLPSARSAESLEKRARSENLTVTVGTKYGYHYLYFPDDGSDTHRHQGGKNFMFEGAQSKSETIANGIIEQLIRKMEG